MRFFAPSRLGPNQSMTAEGFLICQDVPLARTGVQLYGPGEVPITPGSDGMIRIDRDPEEVFRPETIASGNGKYVTIDHPPVDVTPDNCKELGRGHAMNFRRGEGAFDDVLFGDLLVSCPQAINAIKSRALREISLGYDADYEEIAPGHGRQAKIVINHVALLPHGESRCGPRCSIGDHAATCTFRDADAKRSQADVAFEHPAQSQRHCSQCLHYRAVGGACTLVEGRIAPDDWCKLFDLKPFQDSAGGLVLGELERHEKRKHGPLVAHGHRTTDPPRLRRRPFHVHVHM